MHLECELCGMCVKFIQTGIKRQNGKTLVVIHPPLPPLLPCLLRLVHGPFIPPVRLSCTHSERELRRLRNERSLIVFL